MLLIDFTSRAPGAISATISLDVRPFSAARDRVTPARLMSGLASMWALVASIRIRPRQSMSFKAAGALTQSVARITMSHAAASCFVPALAFGPRAATKSPSVSGPREFETMIVWPALIKCRPNVLVTVPAPMKPILIATSGEILSRRDPFPVCVVDAELRRDAAAALKRSA